MLTMVTQFHENESLVFTIVCTFVWRKLLHQIWPQSSPKMNLWNLKVLLCGRLHFLAFHPWRRWWGRGRFWRVFTQENMMRLERGGVMKVTLILTRGWGRGGFWRVFTQENMIRLERGGGGGGVMKVTYILTGGGLESTKVFNVTAFIHNLTIFKHYRKRNFASETYSLDFFLFFSLFCNVTMTYLRSYFPCLTFRT